MKISVVLELVTKRERLMQRPAAEMIVAFRSAKVAALRTANGAKAKLDNSAVLSESCRDSLNCVDLPEDEDIARSHGEVI